jgi:Ca2+-transporting ATPase
MQRQLDTGRTSHSRSVSEVVEELGTDQVQGLLEAEAASRLATLGPNALEQKLRSAPLRLLVEQFADALVVVLLVAVAVSGFVLHEVVDAAVILAIVLLNAALGFTQQYRAEHALDRLRELTAPTATVVRGGKSGTVLAAGLVPGDLISVRAGDRVPADARLCEAHHMATAEAILTGEAFAEEKSAHAVSIDTPLADRTCMVYMGTAVVSGRGLAIVTATGTRTAMGEIAELLVQKSPPTPLQVELERVGRLIGVIALLVVAAVFLIGLLQGYPAHEMFLTAVALAVAAVPEGLPAVVTITLARGVQRLARQSAIVRRLQAVETLGAATVICTDKTGTLTRNQISVHDVMLEGLQGTLATLPADDPRVRRYAEIAALCNDASPDVAGGEPIEAALVHSIVEMGFDVAHLRGQAPREDEAAFDSRRKLMSTLHSTETEGRWLLAVKGAPEVLVGRCIRVQTKSGPRDLGSDGRARITAAAHERAADGLRTLALAYRDLDARPKDLVSMEHELTFVGLVALSDEIRPEAAHSVQIAHRAGIRVVMITGDHPQTAATVARNLKLLDHGSEVLPGDELARLSSEQLRADVHKFAAYARVDPADKVKIVRAWQERGEIVAMTGDGVNDAPALRAADIGVAMGSGSDVSRDSAAIVLADDNFATLVAAVGEGRAIFENLKKVIRFLLTTNASEVFVMSAGFLVFGALGEPLLPAQILWINLVTDGLPVLALAADPPSGELMRHPPARDRSIVGLRQSWGLVWRSLFLAAAAIGALVTGHYLMHLPWQQVQTMLFTTLVVVQLTYAFVIRRHGRGHAFHNSRNLALAVMASLALQLIVVYLPAGNLLFHTAPLGPAEWVAIAAVTGLAMAAIVTIERFSPGRGLPQRRR